MIFVLKKSPLCELCARLNAGPPEKPEVWEDLEDWWLKCEVKATWA